MGILERFSLIRANQSDQSKSVFYLPCIIMKTIRVTAAIMIEDDRVFIAQRHPDDFMGGKWEFPGGKIDPDETPQACLQRELHEELGILTDVHDMFAMSQHTYPNRMVEILAYTVTIREGQITLHEHSDARWVAIQELHEYDMCEADLPFVEKLQQENSHIATEPQRHREKEGRS